MLRRSRANWTGKVTHDRRLSRRIDEEVWQLSSASCDHPRQYRSNGQDQCYRDADCEPLRFADPFAGASILGYRVDNDRQGKRKVPEAEQVGRTAQWITD